MPTYDYKCEKCGHQWTLENRNVRDRTALCPGNHCGGTGKRLISRGTIGKVKGFSEANGYSKGGS